MPSNKKGISVQVDAAIHAELKAYIESHGMTMGEFVALALQDELHPKFNQKEGQNMEKMRTLAFQVPESLFQKIKAYLQRNEMSQKEFVIGLIKAELEREEQTLANRIEEALSGPVSGVEAGAAETAQETAETADLGPVEDAFSENAEDEELDEEGESDYEDEEETEDEGLEESDGLDEDPSESEEQSFSMGM